MVSVSSGATLVMLILVIDDLSMMRVMIQCSTSCDSGLRWRELYCYDRGQLISPAECDQLVAPSSSEPCNLQPCHSSMFDYF